MLPLARVQLQATSFARRVSSWVAHQWREKPQQRQQQQNQSDPVRGSGDRDAQARRTYYGDVSATTQCASTHATPFSRSSSAHLGFSAWQSHALREW